MPSKTAELMLQNQEQDKIALRELQQHKTKHKCKNKTRPGSERTENQEQSESCYVLAFVYHW